LGTENKTLSAIFVSRKWLGAFVLSILSYLIVFEWLVLAIVNLANRPFSLLTNRVTFSHMFGAF
jgi:hypothetical protein